MSFAVLYSSEKFCKECSSHLWYHLGEKQFAPIGSGNLAIQCVDLRALSLLSQPTKAPAKIDSFPFKTATLKCSLSCENRFDRVFFRKINIIIERNFPSR